VYKLRSAARVFRSRQQLRGRDPLKRRHWVPHQATQKQLATCSYH
jgi:hypothetical protein